MFNNLLGFLTRLKYRWLFIRDHGAELNRRVEIENQLAQMGAGNKPLPDKDQCRILALKLGTPKKYWRPEWSH